MSPFIELLKSVQENVCMDEEWAFCQYVQKYYALTLYKGNGTNEKLQCARTTLQHTILTHICSTIAFCQNIIGLLVLKLIFFLGFFKSII